MSTFSVNWFPGHMAKSLKELQQISKFVDFWFEVLDARAPNSSQGICFNNLTKNKPKIIILSKSDLANNKITSSWKSFFEGQGISAVKFNKKSKIKPSILCAINKLKIKKKSKISFKAAVIGVPNVGKSCFINNLVGEKKLKVENKAGVTRNLNWISFENVEICDTPGILPPKIEDASSKKIAYLGLIKSEILNTEEVVLNLISDLGHKASPEKILVEFAKSNGCLLSGGNFDLVRASNLFLKKFREGKFGKISLEAPNE